jgi:hypothetical protein
VNTTQITTLPPHNTTLSKIIGTYDTADPDTDTNLLPVVNKETDPKAKHIGTVVAAMFY